MSVQPYWRNRPAHSSGVANNLHHIEERAGHRSRVILTVRIERRSRLAFVFRVVPVAQVEPHRFRNDRDSVVRCCGTDLCNQLSVTGAQTRMERRDPHAAVAALDSVAGTHKDGPEPGTGLICNFSSTICTSSAVVTNQRPDSHTCTTSNSGTHESLALEH